MPAKPTPLMQRVAAKVEIDSDTDCWIWQGSLTGSGYPQIQGELPGDRRPKLAHRLVYQSQVGEIPEGYVIDHLCYNAEGKSNRLCLNPKHLQAVEQKVNCERGWEAKRKLGIEHHNKGKSNFTERDQYGRFIRPT